LQGKVSLISGAARGIGAAQARLFARNGSTVVIADIREGDGRRLSREIVNEGGIATFVKLDVVSEQDWDRAVAIVMSWAGKLNVLVNSAGVFDRATVEQTNGDSWDALMDVNAKSVLLGTKSVIPAMRKSNGGSIVNISSIAGIVGTLVSTAYNASKGAVRLLTKSTALQYASEGIRVNSIHPGPTETEMLTQLFPTVQDRTERINKIPLGRFALPEDIAYAALFLASDESSFVTGSELVVDGGAIAQ
jgi:NAD(P)-dependent dehydrogenase (short-subunit alcohol dehydrogenase family)